MGMVGLERRKIMKLAVKHEFAINQTGSSQVLIKRPRDRGNSVGNKYEWNRNVLNSREIYAVDISREEGKLKLS